MHYSINEKYRTPDLLPWLTGTPTDTLVTCLLPDFAIYGLKDVVLYSGVVASPVVLEYDVLPPIPGAVSCPSTSRLGGYQCTLTGQSFGTKAGATAAGMILMIRRTSPVFLVECVTTGWTHTQIEFTMPPFRGVPGYLVFGTVLCRTLRVVSSFQ